MKKKGKNIREKVDPFATQRKKPQIGQKMETWTERFQVNWRIYRIEKKKNNKKGRRGKKEINPGKR